ncbi:hypothetical protein Cni_G11121 [Canna indica]|uniref:Endonuclease/exonuclease/phosphatase domain-containing protein n=1 Tax=Canna indica TaxID=4628 RepID=A0AAQ3K9L5_9LILI|nr:hypothetical protein Cni_G11121 [Canna indica]
METSPTNHAVPSSTPGTPKESHAVAASILGTPPTIIHAVSTSVPGIPPSTDDNLTLRLVEHEDETDLRESTYCLVGKLWTDKHQTLSTLQMVLSSIWNNSIGFRCEKVDHRVYKFYFSDQIQMKKNTSKPVLVIQKSTSRDSTMGRRKRTCRIRFPPGTILDPTLGYPGTNQKYSYWKLNISSHWNSREGGCILNQRFTRFHYKSQPKLAPTSPMNTLIWNCQGLGNPLTIRHLRNLRFLHSPDCLFLMEIKQDDNRFKNLLQQCGFDQCFIIPAVGIAGGLILAWKSHFNVQILSSDSFYIHATCDTTDGLSRWQFFGLHLHCDRATRKQQIQFLLRKTRNRNRSILLGGDFNTIMRASEKMGGQDFNCSMAKDLSQLLNEGELLEFPTSGHAFTWSNKRASPHHIEKVLDRFLTTSDWQDTWKNWYVFHLGVMGSDHCRLLLRPVNHKNKRKDFKFDKRCLAIPAISSIVSEA